MQYRYATNSAGQGPGTGQQDSLTYPNGTKVSYVYCAAGQISQINWGNSTTSSTSVGNPLVTDITYTPLGIQGIQGHRGSRVRSPVLQKVTLSTYQVKICSLHIP